jgi:hypothetical protein
MYDGYVKYDNNYDLDNVVQTWKQARQYLVDLEEKSDKGKNKVEASPSTSQVQLEHQLERSTISCEYESQPPSKTDDEDGDFKDASSCSPPPSSSANHTTPLPDTNSSTRM